MGTDGTIETRQWQRRGLLLLFVFGVANLIGALVSFVAFNWTYLATGAKLGGLGALLLIAAAIWVWRGFDRPVAVIAGILAQILIGVWLAAAGQLYQAPGGLQDLLMHWALLGLPFAFASRSQAHWAVWYAVVGLFAVSGMGLILREWVGWDDYWVQWLVGAALAALGLMARLLRHESGWLNTILAAMSAFLLAIIPFATYGLPEIQDFIALALASLLAIYLYRKGLMAETMLMAASVGVIVLMILMGTLDRVFIPEVPFFLIVAAYALGATYGLLRLGRNMAASRAGVPAESDRPDDLPWYVTFIAGLGGFTTACFVGAVLGAVVELSGLLQDNADWIALGLGTICLVWVSVWKADTAGPFLKTIRNVVAIAGVGLMIVAVTAFEFGNLEIGLTAIALAVGMGWRFRNDLVLEGIMAIIGAIGIGMVIWSFAIDRVDNLEIFRHCVYAVYILIALGFATRPVAGKRRLLVTAIALTMAFLIAMTANWAYSADSVLIFVELTLLVIGVAWIAFGSDASQAPGWPVWIGAVIFAALMPVGAAAGLLLGLVGYSYRSRPVFGLGVAALVLIMLRHYFKLDATLLMVSLYMALAGGLLLALWWTSRRRVEALS